jgi:hypothetical protein
LCDCNDAFSCSPRLSNRLKPQKKWTKAGTTSEAANGTGVALSPGNKAILFVKRDSSKNREVTAMNVRNAFSRRSSVTLNTRARSRSTRRRKASSASPGKSWFKSGGATPDYDLREVVAQRFMSMNEAHDRIRNELLASRSLETN